MTESVDSVSSMPAVLPPTTSPIRIGLAPASASPADASASRAALSASSLVRENPSGPSRRTPCTSATSGTR